MITIDVYDDTGVRSQWFRNFIARSGPLVSHTELQNWADEWNAVFRYDTEQGRKSLWPHWLDFEDEQDASLFLLRWS